MKERDIYLRILKQVQDIETTPNWILMQKMMSHPDIKYPNRVEVAASIKINVNQIFIDDDELVSETVMTYVNVLNKMWNIFDGKHPYDVATKAFMAKVQTIDITYTYED